MTRLQFTISSPRRPDEVLAALTDFSAARPGLWPSIDPGVYRVHAAGDTWADVTEGSAVMGGIWARERYDWSTAGVVRATVADANLWHAGGIWEMRVQPDPAGGSILEVTRDRQPRTAKGRLLEALLRIVGRTMLAKDLLAAPAISGAPVAAISPPTPAEHAG
jgi:hypothetical protein